MSGLRIWLASLLRKWANALDTSDAITVRIKGRKSREQLRYVSHHILGGMIRSGMVKIQGQTVRDCW